MGSTMGSSRASGMDARPPHVYSSSVPPKRSQKQALVHTATARASKHSSNIRWQRGIKERKLRLQVRLTSGNFMPSRMKKTGMLLPTWKEAAIKAGS